MQNKEAILALIKLIDDPDEGVYTHVHDRLLSFGAEVIPFLENSWEVEDYGLLFQERIENLIHEIQFEATKSELKDWIDSEEKDLLKGAILVAKYQYPGLDEQAIYDEFDRIQRDVWLEVNDDLTALEKVRILNKVIFGTYQFQGNTKNFHSPMNSYINVVLESKKGNPLSLSLVYSIIAQRLGFPIYGVNLPNQFVLAYMDEDAIHHFIGKENKYGVLFYINPFSRGTIFDENEINDFLDKLKVPHNREFYEPCSNTAIIKRMLTNLVSSFQQVGNAEKVEELITLRALFE